MFVLISLIGLAGERLRKLSVEAHSLFDHTQESYTHFTDSHPDREELVTVLLDLLGDDDDDIHFNTFRLLFDMYQVHIIHTHNVQLNYY